MAKEISLAVRKIVEFVLASGDLELDRYVSSSRALAGIRAHKKIQKNRGEDYHAEVPVSLKVQKEDLIINISGRIDGVYTENNTTVIEEIKSTTENENRLKIHRNNIHWGQAKIYAYIYCTMHSLKSIDIVLLYYNIDDRHKTEFKEHYSLEDLNIFFDEVIDKYYFFAKMQAEWEVIRNKSIVSRGFPFPLYRAGQRQMAISTYICIRDKRNMLIQAPTGIGKTIGTIFPAVKRIPEVERAKVFYLTARGTGKKSAEHAVKQLHEQTARFKTITLTAKEKICFNPGAACNGRECNFAKGYYDRVNEALVDIFQLDDFTRDTIEKYALKYLICPFEFSLYLSLWCDIIICDYNYAFDPRVRLKRYFVEPSEFKKNNYYFLVDEAHNLVDRSRRMFSAELSKKSVLNLRKLLKKTQPELYKHLSNINKWMLEARKQVESNGGDIADVDPPETLYPLLRRFKKRADTWLALNFRTDFRRRLMDFYFEITAFLRIAENFDNDYRTLYQKQGSELTIRLFCLDPSRSLIESMEPVNSSVFFSATVTPMPYFCDLFGLDSTSELMDIDSPFPKDNLCLILADGISTRYRDRKKSLPDLSKMIETFCSAKQGNFLVFFPSYKYLKMVREQLNIDNAEIIEQYPGMNQNERTEFIEKFHEDRDNRLVALAVMGGIFGEGIDLMGERLEGAIIVGVGLPGIDFERDQIRSYYQNRDKGFEYAYMYPGLIRVLQAAGRVIRSEEDKGAVLLIDDRFASYRYKRLFPDYWSIKRCKNDKTLRKILKDFW